MSAHAGKTVVAKRTTSPERVVTYRDVLAALQGEYARFLALGLYRSAGYAAKDFTARRAARAAMAKALTVTEDALELRGGRREREAIRVVRRLLENEVYP